MRAYIHTNMCTHIHTYMHIHIHTQHNTTLHNTTLNYNTPHYTTLHYTTLHYTTLHCTTLHYTTLSFLISFHAYISPRSIGNLFSWGPVATDNYYYRETRYALGPLSNITVKQPMEYIKTLKKMDIPIIIGMV